MPFARIRPFTIGPTLTLVASPSLLAIDSWKVCCCFSLGAVGYSELSPDTTPSLS